MKWHDIFKQMKEGKQNKTKQQQQKRKQKKKKKTKITLTSQAVTQIQQRNQKLYGQGNPKRIQNH